MRELYEAMLEESRDDIERGMERAAQRTVRKAELKVAFLSIFYIRFIPTLAP